jgi:4-diphosphocytidyl-2-C-methyl-D-erythritol kinase
MIVFPNCKINLGLNVVQKRTDGYHDLETVFLPLSLSDCLEIIPSQNSYNEFSSGGIGIPQDGSENLCIKAWKLMHKNYDIPYVKMHLHKIIPAGAGLGGGSSDAAFTLLTLNELYSLKLNKVRLKELAAEIGSDCAFFIENTPCFATGRGEILTATHADLSGKHLALIIPPVHVSTRDAFAGIVPQKPAHSLQDMIGQPVSQWKDHVINDFEKSVFAKFPEIKVIKDKLYGTGAVFASMSGSGSSVYGIFEREFDIKDLMKEFPRYFVWKQILT